MSEENVKIVKRALHAWNERDRDSVDTLFHRAFEYHGRSEWPDLGRMYRGPAEALPRQSEVDAQLDEFRAEPLEVIEAGDQVVCILEMTAIGKQSRIPVRFSEPSVVTIREGQIARIEVYDSRKSALEAAGLSE